MKIIKKKAFAYITAQQHLLVFCHPYAPEAGIQVPAGTIEDNETPEQAVLREAFEETGLPNLTLSKFLGEAYRDMAEFGRNEIHHRFFYHLEYNGDLSDSWQYEERYSATPTSDPEPIIFQFSWVPLPHGVPPLIADHNSMLHHLLDDRGE